MIKKVKGLELIILFLYSIWAHIWFKHAFNLEDYGFWKCGLNKSYSYLYNRRHDCIIYMI